jgi:hypothetical protein
MVACAYPNYAGNINRTEVQADLGINARPSLKNNNCKLGAGGSHL